MHQGTCCASMHQGTCVNAPGHLLCVNAPGHLLQTCNGGQQSHRALPWKVCGRAWPIVDMLAASARRMLWTRLQLAHGGCCGHARSSRMADVVVTLVALACSPLHTHTSVWSYTWAYALLCVIFMPADVVHTAHACCLLSSKGT